jgi:hypothetical protein
MDKLEAHAQGERPEKAFYQIGYSTIDSSDISHIIYVFYDALDSKDKYENEQNEQAVFLERGIPFRMFITKFNGDRYIEDKDKEAHLKSCVFFVRNEDDNCLHAALFAALAYRDRKVMIDNTEHKFEGREFETGRSMSNYNAQCKTHNLRFFTYKLKELLE